MVIGIAGTIGAGKGEVVSFLKEQNGFSHISARHMWAQELEARGIPVNRDTMTVLANELRAEHGADYFVKRALKEAGIQEDVVIESVRTVAEMELLKQHGGVLLAVDAKREERFRRISGRGSALDDVTFEDFVRQEDTEMANEDPNKQNIAKVIAAADYTICNEGTLEELHAQIDFFLAKYTV